MSFGVSPGIYDRIVDQSFNVNASGLVAGAIIISSDKGTLDVNIVTSAKQFVENYGVPSSDHPSKWGAVRFLERGGILSVKRVINDAVAATGETTNSGDARLTFTAENPGAWGNDINITFEDVSAKEGTGIYNIIVTYDGNVVETWMVSETLGTKDGYGNNIYVEDVINGKSKYVNVVLDASGDSFTLATESVDLSAGADDTAAVSSADIVTGWDDFLDTESVPATFLINAGFTDTTIQNKMLSVAETRRDCVAILDVPQADSTDASSMVTFRETTLNADSYWGALYGGWIRIYDKYNDREIYIPPSGDVAAVYAYTFDVAERWDAPAGTRRGIIPNALGVSKAFDEGERDLLYDAGINPVTKIAGSNAVVYGQKTLQLASSALDRVNVVNSILFMNKQMKESLAPFLFEANTAFVRNSINFLLTSFLENIKQRGGLYDYSVDTSEEINTPFVIDQNQLLVDVFVQPTKTAEYIRQSVIITPTGITFS